MSKDYEIKQSTLLLRYGLSTFVDNITQGAYRLATLKT